MPKALMYFLLLETNDICCPTGTTSAHQFSYLKTPSHMICIINVYKKNILALTFIISCVSSQIYLHKIYSEFCVYYLYTLVYDGNANANKRTSWPHTNSLWRLLRCTCPIFRSEVRLLKAFVLIILPALFAL